MEGMALDLAALAAFTGVILAAIGLQTRRLDRRFTELKTDTRREIDEYKADVGRRFDGFQQAFDEHNGGSPRQGKTPNGSSPRRATIGVS